MKTQTHIPSLSLLPRYIDTAPMAASYHHLCGMILTLMACGRMREVLTATRQVSRLVKDFVKAEFGNQRRQLKLDMLSRRGWRECVLKELGGLRKLDLWEAARARYELRKTEASPEPEPTVWRKTPERLAEEERLKVHARKCARAAAHPNIFRDPFRVDQEGQFRLAPLPRMSRPRRDPATVPFDIMDYDYDGTYVAKMSGYDAPITVWPVEFRAAAKLERDLMERDVEERRAQPVIPEPYWETQTENQGPDLEDYPLLLGPLFRGDGKRDSDDPARELPD